MWEHRRIERQWREAEERRAGEQTRVAEETHRQRKWSDTQKRLNDLKSRLV